MFSAESISYNLSPGSYAQIYDDQETIDASHKVSVIVSTQDEHCKSILDVEPAFDPIILGEVFYTFELGEIYRTNFAQIDGMFADILNMMGDPSNPVNIND